MQNCDWMKASKLDPFIIAQRVKMIQRKEGFSENKFSEWNKDTNIYLSLSLILNKDSNNFVQRKWRLRSFTKILTAQVYLNHYQPILTW